MLRTHRHSQNEQQKNQTSAAGETNLYNTQRQFFAALKEPIFAESRDRTDLPARQGQVSQNFIATAQKLIRPSAALRPVERLELYHRQYWYRLLDSIAEDFPSLQDLLGDAVFWGLMEAFLLAQPPSTYNLRQLGAGLVDFIAGFDLEAELCIVAEDLARIEYALCMAFEAADRPVVQPQQLATTKLDLQPHLSLMSLRSSADTLWRRFDAGRKLKKWPTPRNAPHRYVVVYRLQQDFRVERLPRAAFMILRAIAQTGSLDAALDQVLKDGELKRKRDRDQIGQWFGQWTAKGWICKGQQDLDKH